MIGFALTALIWSMMLAYGVVLLAVAVLAGIVAIVISLIVWRALQCALQLFF